MKTLLERVVFATLSLALAMPVAGANFVQTHENTPVYLVTTKEIIAKRKTYDVGDTIPVEVWRDVVVDGYTVIKAGTPATLRVDSIKGRSVVGISGKVSFGAVETTAADGQTVHLGGGYNKKGAGRIALSATLGALVFWPALFIPGGVPRFPEGTVFDAYTDGSYNVEILGDQRRVIQLSSGTRFTAEMDYDKLLATEKPKHFDILLYETEGQPEFVIDNINGESIEPLELQNLGEEDGHVRTSIDIKTLSKKFQRGINRFEVAYVDDSGDRIASEVILEIEF